VDPYITHTGRAMPLRRVGVGTDQIIPAARVLREDAAGLADSLFAAWREDRQFVLNQSAYAGATILVAGPGFGIGPSRLEAARALADYGFRAMISARFGDTLYNDMIQAGIVPAQLPANVVDQLMQTIETDPQIPIAIDLGRREVSTGGEPCGVFEIDECVRQRLMTGRDALADLLQAAQRSLVARDLATDQRARLQRRLVAICDAMKAPGADMAHGSRRLEEFLGELGRADGNGA